MEQFLEFVISSLVDHPEDVIVTRAEEGRKIQFRVRLRQNDVGKVIGKNGHVIESLRILLNASAARQGRRAFLEIIE